jgi:hypothetical protein
VTRRGWGATGLLAWLAICTSLAIGLGTPPVRAGPLPLPSALPSLGLPTPLPSLGLPTPLPSIGLPTPLPSIGTPLPTLSLAFSPSPAPSGASSSPATSESAASSPSVGTKPGASGDAGGGANGIASGVPATTAAPASQLSVPQAPPLPPSLPDLGSWLVPTLGVAVPAVVVAALVALQLIGGAAALRVVHASLDRIGSYVPSWLSSNERLSRGRKN